MQDHVHASVYVDHRVVLKVVSDVSHYLCSHLFVNMRCRI